MKFKNLFLIFTLFMVLLCCFSAVSASEDVSEDIVSVSDDAAMDEVVSEVDSGDESIKVSNDNGLESVDGSGNESLATQDVGQVSNEELTAADNGQNSDKEIGGSRSSTTIYSWNSLYSELNSNSGNAIVNIGANLTPTKQIVIKHSVTIVGSADTYIGGSDANNKASYTYIPFMVSKAGLSVTFKNIRFQNAGDNIFIQFSGNGQYNIINCSFINMYATGDHKSIVYLNNGEGNITDCTFEDCNTSFSTITNYRWGTYNLNMIVRNCTFRNNYANTEPGAINNCAHLIVYDSTFEGNSAEWWAGAIHTHSYANTTIINSVFKDNLAGWNGGALYTYSYLKVINSTFLSNIAVGNSVGGGAIAASSYGSNPTVIIENSIFKYNQARNMRGGAISVIDSCVLNVYNSVFVNNSALNDLGNAISDYYSGSSNTSAYFTYINNTFYGPNNGYGSVYAGNEYLNIVNLNNSVMDYIFYVDPDENNTNTSGSVVPIPTGATIGTQKWNASLSGALGGTPLVNGERIYVPNGQAIYCLNITNGNLLWNVSSPWGYFHELALHDGVLIAPCSWDKFYMYNATSGIEIQPTSNMYQASSYYAPAIDGNTIYVSSEYPYGDGGNKWIAVVEYVNGTYNYTGSILEINNASSALISAPILWNNYLWVNTVNGLMRVDLATNTSTIVLANTVGKPVLGGDYIYVLTRNNHICGVNANGNVIKNIAVSGNVGSTLAINTDNTVLYTVNANGNIYRAAINSNSADLLVGQNVNPVSSALVVGNDGYLYIGDDEGILWVIRPYSLGIFWFDEVIWAYNTSSSISGMPVITNNIVYIGNENTFYALSKVSNRLNTNNKMLSNFNSVKKEYELLGAFNTDEILSTTSRVISPNSQLKTNDFKYGDSIYLLNGTYTLEAGFTIGVDPNTYSGLNNILIKPIETATASIIIDESIQQYAIAIAVGQNITFENIKFTADSTKTFTNFMTVIMLMMGPKDITFKNCTFENIINKHHGSSSGSFSDIIHISDQNDMAQMGWVTGDVKFEGCKFINVSAVDATIWVESSTSDLYVSDCIFENNTVPYVLNLYKVKNTYLTDNAFDSTVPTTVVTGKIADASFNVLTQSLTVGETGSIVAELVDDNNNRIYSANLKFKINGVEQTPTFNSTTGLYTVKYTPSSLDSISVNASCSNVDILDEDNDPILVKAITDLIVNCNDEGVYGTEFKVNATLDSTISGENITFTVLDSTNGLVKSVNTTITGGFASYSFADLPAGDYTLVADYTGGTSFAPASDSKAFTITQADSSIEITVLNDIIHVGDTINVKAVVPTGATGNVTFRLENNKTVDVSEVAIFDGLSAGNYTIYAIYNGDANYKASTEANVEIEVVKYDLNLTITADNINYGEVLVVKVHTNSNFTGGIFVYIGESKQGAPIFNGEGNATFANLTAAEYFITANFTGDDFFYADSANTTATVKGVEVPADKAISTNVPANTKSPTFSIKLEKDATGTFTVNIDNGKIVKTAELKDGAASITVADLTAGDHTISVSYSGDGKYAPITQNTTLNIKEPVKPTPKVSKKATKIVAKKKTFKAKKKTKKYTITLKSGKKLISKVKVTIKVGKKTYTAKTNKKGKATFNLKKLTKKGKYTAVIKFKGNKNYKATSKKVKITVKK